MTLRERIEAELDRKQAIAEKVQYDPKAGGWRVDIDRHGKIWIRDEDGDELAEVGVILDADQIVTFANPASVLAGLAEDRDILKRHRESEKPAATPLGEFTVCVYCSDLDSDPVRVVGWPCWDAISVGRRHGIAP